MLTRILATAALVAVLATSAHADDTKPNPETLRLQRAVYRLQMENLQLRQLLAQAEQRALAAAGAQLESESLKAAGAPAGATWDWARDAPVLPPTPPPADPPKP